MRLERERCRLRDRVALMEPGFGLFGNLAQSVGRQRRDLGVRMALGARRGRVLAMVVRRGL